MPKVGVYDPRLVFLVVIHPQLDGQTIHRFDSTAQRLLEARLLEIGSRI